MDTELPMNMSQYVEQMRGWVERQPHLPKDFDDLLLLRFVHSCMYDVDQAKATLEKFSGIRASAPELFADRNIQAGPLKAQADVIDFATYDISNNRKLFVWKVNDPGLDVYDYVQDCKLFTLAFDAHLLAEADIKDGAVVLLDARHINYKFMRTFNIFTCKKIVKYQLESLPVRIVQVHVVNASPAVDAVLTAMRPFMSREILQIIKLHPPSSGSLYEHLDRSDLPVDYGGTLPAVDATKHKDIENNIMKNSDLLQKEGLWAATGKKHGDLSMDIGNFRALHFD